MLFWRILSIGFFVLFIFAATYAEASSSPAKLGKVEFPTSGSGEAQRHFLRGVAALHSFWYDEALKAFRQSTQVNPEFVMGYWGEAMAYNRPLWESQDTREAQEILAKIPATKKVTPRERAYVDAVKLLYGKGDKLFRDQAYSRAMEKIYKDYPDDLEAACFYALSLLGVTRHSEQKFRLKVQAGAIGLDVFEKSPDHPCAAHYTIHAFDHPDLAVLALPAARRYARIAPASHHAQHMSAHIFVQLGMWQEAAASNEAGWQTSVNWVEREGLPTGKRDYHSLQWLHYAYLQQGRYEKAAEVFRLKLKDMEALVPDAKANRRVGKYFERMAGASVFEGERWKWGSSLENPPGWKPKPYVLAAFTFVRGFSAAKQGLADAERHLSDLKAIRRQGHAKNYFDRPQHLEIWELELQAAIRESNKDYDEAIALIKKATLLEETLPAPSGPPKILKPTYELLGEILLAAGKHQQAAQQFATSLLRHPNRARSLLGAARAAANSGNKAEAAELYGKFLAVWVQADPDLPELREARSYVQARKK